MKKLILKIKIGASDTFFLKKCVTLDYQTPKDQF